MDIKQIYREETNLEPHFDVGLDCITCFSIEYVKWLEAKLTLTHDVKSDSEQCDTHFVGRTFFALYESSSGTRHDRMMFVNEGLNDKGFFDWVQSERVKIEKDKKTAVCIMDCNVI
jgi:hypothetical protein